MNSEKRSSRVWSRSVALFALRHLSTVAVCLLLASGCAATTPREYVSEEELHAIVVQHNLSARDLDRVVCRRESPTGSHLTTTRCRTVRQIQRERDAVNRRLPTHNVPGGP